MPRPGSADWLASQLAGESVWHLKQLRGERRAFLASQRERLASETAGEREMRLSRERLRRAARQRGLASETAEERETCLSRERLHRAARQCLFMYAFHAHTPSITSFAHTSRLHAGPRSLRPPRGVVWDLLYALCTDANRRESMPYTVSEWFNPLEPPRTFSNHFSAEKARCVEVFDMSSEWFDFFQDVLP